MFNRYAAAHAVERGFLMTQRLPRGIRNNNPGNVRISGIKWQGKCDVQTDDEFIQFVTPIMGLRAMMKVILTYQRKYGIRTIRGIVNRWAPPVGDRNGSAAGGEYRQDTRAYIDHVARELNATPDEQFDVHDPSFLIELTKHMVIHENGYPARNKYPKYWYRDIVYIKAAELALGINITSEDVSRMFEQQKAEREKNAVVTHSVTQQLPTVQKPKVENTSAVGKIWAFIKRLINTEQE